MSNNNNGNYFIYDPELASIINDAEETTAFNPDMLAVRGQLLEEDLTNEEKEQSKNTNNQIIDTSKRASTTSLTKLEKSQVAGQNRHHWHAKRKGYHMIWRDGHMLLGGQGEDTSYPSFLIGRMSTHAWNNFFDTLEKISQRINQCERKLWFIRLLEVSLFAVLVVQGYSICISLILGGILGGNFLILVISLYALMYKIPKIITQGVGECCFGKSKINTQLKRSWDDLEIACEEATGGGGGGASNSCEVLVSFRMKTKQPDPKNGDHDFPVRIIECCIDDHGDEEHGYKSDCSDSQTDDSEGFIGGVYGNYKKRAAIFREMSELFM